MATTVADYIVNLKKVVTELPNEHKRIVLYNQEEIIDYNRNDQLFDRGVGTKNSLLGLYSNNYFYESGKNQNSKGFPKLLNNHFNFLHSGQLFESLYISYKDKWSFQIVSNVSYLKDLQDKTFSDNGNDILGLTEENIEKVDKEIIKPQLDKWLLKYL